MLRNDKYIFFTKVQTSSSPRQLLSWNTDTIMLCFPANDFYFVIVNIIRSFVRNDCDDHVLRIVEYAFYARTIRQTDEVVTKIVK